MGLVVRHHQPLIERPPINGRQGNAAKEFDGELGWMTGFEPATSGATVRRSTAELHPPFQRGTSKVELRRAPRYYADGRRDKRKFYQTSRARARLRP
jgi:hypothetical protein